MAVSREIILKLDNNLLVRGELHYWIRNDERLPTDEEVCSAHKKLTEAMIAAFPPLKPNVNVSVRLNPDVLKRLEDIKMAVKAERREETAQTICDLAEKNKGLQIGTGTVQADVDTDGVAVSTNSGKGSLLLPWNLIAAGVSWLIGLFRKGK